MAEFVRRELSLGRNFDSEQFTAALRAFGSHYSVRPERGVCAPDVFARVVELFASAAAVHLHSTRVRVEGIPIVVGIVAPGTIAFEGHVDETKMGDW